MKRLSLLAVATLALGLAASAQTLSRDTFNISVGGGGSVGTTNSYFVIGAKSVYGGAPLVTYVDATSDLTTSVIQCYRVGYVMRATVTNSTTTVYVDAVPSGATNAGIIVIRHLADDSYERLAVTSTSSSTNLTTTVAPATTTVPGDFVYYMHTNGKIPVGNTNKAVSGVGIFAGQKDLPLLIEVNGTSACTLNAVRAHYER